jgi:hypothetical protein
MSKAFQGGKSKSAARVMRAGLNCFAQTLSYFITARVGHFLADGTGAAADVTVKSGISVGAANCFLASAYTLSPVVGGEVMQKARACMYVAHRTDMIFVN